MRRRNERFARFWRCVNTWDRPLSDPDFSLRRRNERFAKFRRCVNTWERPVSRCGDLGFWIWFRALRETFVRGRGDSGRTSARLHAEMSRPGLVKRALALPVLLVG